MPSEKDVRRASRVHRVASASGTRRASFPVEIEQLLDVLVRIELRRQLSLRLSLERLKPPPGA